MRSAKAITVLFLSAAAGTLVACSHKHSGAITIDGSDTVYLLSKAMADAFHQSNPAVQFNVQFSGTGGGFRKFCAGGIDIQGASRPINDTEGAQCKANGHQMELLMLKYSIEVVGWLAAAGMLSAYLLLASGRLSSRSNLYHWMNVLSGAGFVINSGWNGAYPSAAINVIWAAIGLYGVFGRQLGSHSGTAS